MSRLRAQLGPALAARGGGYALDIPPDALDADRFEALVDAAQRRRRQPTPPTCSPPPSTCGTAPPTATAPTSSASAPRPAAWRNVAEGHGKPAPSPCSAPVGIDEAVAAAEALVAAEPLREGGWAVLIEALAGAHRTADALRAYRRAAAALAEVGLEPTRALRDAEQIALNGRSATPCHRDAVRNRPIGSVRPTPGAVVVRRPRRRREAHRRARLQHPPRHPHRAGRRRQDTSRPRGRPRHRTAHRTRILPRRAGQRREPGSRARRHRDNARPQCRRKGRRRHPALGRRSRRADRARQRRARHRCHRGRRRVHLVRWRVGSRPRHEPGAAGDRRRARLDCRAARHRGRRCIRGDPVPRARRRPSGPRPTTRR